MLMLTESINDWDMEDFNGLKRGESQSSLISLAVFFEGFAIVMVFSDFCEGVDWCKLNQKLRNHGISDIPESQARSNRSTARSEVY
jgi:hypothetical protein